MSDAQKNRILEEFQHYLEQADLAPPITVTEQPDLCTLLSELAGLKTEVKAESRQFKNTLDTLAGALSTLQTGNKALSEDLAGYPARLQQQRSEVLRAVLLDIVDIHDRLGAGLTVLNNYSPVDALFKHSQKQDVRFVESFKEGQAMLLKRFDQLLQRYRISPIECIGKPLDPRAMNAVETGRDATLGNGIVIEELRKGYLFEDQVLRLAEVKVNKL
jgi:molecular chaperone GrpE